MTQLTPEQEDAFIHQHLASLASFAPSASFADKVMAEVVRPAPAWVRSVQHVYRTVVNRETRWVWATGMAASAAFSFAVYFTLVTTQWGRLQSAWAGFVRTTLPEVWASLTSASGSTATLFLSVAETLATTPGFWPAALLGSLAVMMGSAWGLRRTVREFQAERVPARVAR